MAKEAAIRDKLELPVNFAQQNEAGLEKGTILQLVDERTASGTQSSGMMIAGICAREKVEGDGRPVAVYLRGIFDCVASGVIAIGDPVGMATEENHVVSIGGANKTSVSGMAILGKALGAATTNETVQIYVNVGGGI